jgi:C1A family cysteine protease
MPDENETMKVTPAMGWLPDYPDFRDYTIRKKDIPSRLKNLGQKDSIKEMVKKLGVEEPEGADIPEAMNLRDWCSEVENQLTIGSCTAHAGVGVMEYYERRAFGRHIDASRLFLYKTTRNLLHWTGDRGAFLRTTMAAMVLFGVPPEEYWTYNVSDYDKEPSSFCYSFAQNYQALQYGRLDPIGTPKDFLLKQIKSLLAAGIPSMFGFTVFSSIQQAKKNGGKIPFPCKGEKIHGGHAVVAVGYDDKIKIKNTIGESQTTGALMIRNSWGTGWGDNGYGWLPYDFVLEGLAKDWWILLKNEWIDTKNFGL